MYIAAGTSTSAEKSRRDGSLIRVGIYGLQWALDVLILIGSFSFASLMRFGHLPDSPLTARRIGETGQVVVASPAYLKRHGTPQQPEDLLQHNCLRFNFRRAEPNWPFIREGQGFSLKVCGNIECSSGEALAQLAREGAGITRIGEFSVTEDLQRGDLVPLLQAFNPGDREPIHAVFVGGTAMPARVWVCMTTRFFSVACM